MKSASKRSLPRTGLALGAAILLSTAFVAPRTASAQKADIIPEDVVKKEKKKKKKKKKKDGWFPKLQAGVGFAFSQNQGVVGVPDGVSMSLGLQLHGGLEFRYKTHSWITALRIIHTQSKVPNIDPFIKSGDEFYLSTLYQYRFPKVKWLGVFAGVRMTTALLPGSVVPLEDTNIDKTPADTTDRGTTPGIAGDRANRGAKQCAARPAA